ncbi:MAG TPA: thiamine pyrophosphate-binding protein [Terriglobales bacterium]|jgi:acetolactate synthase-1/2/3 large subunit|nr:thiamine pyrophosphate-binding protein [Terriglobales bacterium]
MKLSDYIVGQLAEWGVRHIFLVTGGGAMHLNDSIGKEPRIRYVCNHHEQASGMAAEAYARVSGQPGVVNVTTGPGGINAINGVFGAWTDSVPMLIISGQVKRETCMRSLGITGLRQLGDQEADIVAMVGGITKHAALVNDPFSVRYHLERAWHLAQSGRPGPCWLDIPVDVQAASIDPASLRSYDPAEDELRQDEVGNGKDDSPRSLEGNCREVLDRIQNAKRPVILAGTGVRAAHAVAEFDELIHRLGIPVATAWTCDLIPSDDALYCGRQGTIGNRAGNFAVQSADLLLILGSRLNIRQTSYNWQSFAPRAFKIQVDIDAAEFHKPTVHPDLGIHCNLKYFLPALMRQCDTQEYRPEKHAQWLDWCRERVRRYPVVQDRQRHAGPPLNPYYFIEQLSDKLTGDDVVVCGDASACIVPFQTMHLRKGQRLISNSGCASMGYDLPAAIGAAFARPGKRVICIAGDGSIQMNIQELQTIVHHHLPVKIFVLNNSGYLSMRMTQSGFFGRLTGESALSGTSFPDMVKVACAYGIPSLRIDRRAQLEQIDRALASDGPALIDVVLDRNQEFEPRSRARQLPDGRIVSPNLEDMYPFLDETELMDNVIKE